MKYLKRVYLLLTFAPLVMLYILVATIVGGADSTPWRWWSDYEHDYLHDMFNEK